MRRDLIWLVLFVLIIVPLQAFGEELPPIPPIKRLLPPPGIEIPADVRAELEAKLVALAPRIERLTDDQQRPDVEVFIKAVSFALRFAEFYDKKDFDKARWALAQAEERLALAEKNEAPWTKQAGLVVRGYRSSIDGSVQPYGLVIPDKHDFTKPCPLYVWLHGRGDKETDLHFIHGRARNKGDIVPANAIVVHAFGRQCLGFKSAGEIDVLEATNRVQIEYATHPRATVLIGFSMGGAGAWHIGAHYPYWWCAVSPGAGFADVARYQKLKPANYPAHYEQKLWGMYDVPDYTRNLFNLPVIAYSGEIDPQKQAADLMAEAFKNEGRELQHLIGPGTAHKYHPETKQELLARLDKIVQAEIANYKKPFVIAPEAHLQTRTLRYHTGGWLKADGLKEHWQDSRVDGAVMKGDFTITTKNITRFQVFLSQNSTEEQTFNVDGQTVERIKEDDTPWVAHFALNNGRWKSVAPFSKQRAEKNVLSKTPGLQGPIDDAFLGPILVVLPSSKSQQPRVQQWLEFETRHFLERWSATFRGSLKVVRDDEILSDRELAGHNIILWGDPSSNSYIESSLARLPLAWNEKVVQMAGVDYDSSQHVPVMIYPSPYDPTRYIVLNSGPTFREAHDRTNSLQNPKLPDWAIIDITTPPDGEKPGKVVAADFFDEQWQVK